jgi:hypothetical protein
LILTTSKFRIPFHHAMPFAPCAVIPHSDFRPPFPLSYLSHFRIPTSAFFYSHFRNRLIPSPTFVPSHLLTFLFSPFPPGRRPRWPLRLPARRASLQLGEAGGRIFSRGIVPPHRTTTGPNSLFPLPYSHFRIPTSHFRIPTSHFRIPTSFSSALSFLLPHL